MRYLLLIHSEAGWNELSLEEQNARRERYGAFARSTPAGVILKADELAPTATATTVRVRDGETLVTDGPYAETKEALGGYFLVEADSIDEAVELAKRLPEPLGGGGIEIRPVHVDEGGQP
jgi:hypothetical protein